MQLIFNSGRECEIEDGGTCIHGNSCLNGGVCYRHANGSEECLCPLYYTGDTCEQGLS